MADVVVIDAMRMYKRSMKGMMMIRNMIVCMIILMSKLTGKYL